MKSYVPQHFKDITGINQKQGESAETRFQKLYKDLNYTIEHATPTENYKKHIDFWVSRKNLRFSVDVKAAKRIARRDRNGHFTQVQDKLHWIEWSNRGGGSGWVRGKADKIAFGMCNGNFILVQRQALKDYIGPIIESKRHIKPRNQFECVDGILWKRRGNKDEMTLVRTDVLHQIPGTFVIRHKKKQKW